MEERKPCDIRRFSLLRRSMNLSCASFHLLPPAAAGAPEVSSRRSVGAELDPSSSAAVGAAAAADMLAQVCDLLSSGATAYFLLMSFQAKPARMGKMVPTSRF